MKFATAVNCFLFRKKTFKARLLKTSRFEIRSAIRVNRMVTTTKPSGRKNKLFVQRNEFFSSVNYALVLGRMIGILPVKLKQHKNGVLSVEISRPAQLYSTVLVCVCFVSVFAFTEWLLIRIRAALILRSYLYSRLIIVLFIYAR